MTEKLAPPRIPPERRREAIEAATAKANKRGRLRRASSSHRKRKESPPPPPPWLCTPPAFATAAALPPLSPTSNATSLLTDSTADVSSSRSTPNMESGGSECSAGSGGSGGGCAAAVSLNPSLKRPQGKGCNGRSCPPPLARRITPQRDAETLVEARGARRSRRGPRFRVEHRGDCDVGGATVSFPLSPVDRSRAIRTSTGRGRAAGEDRDAPDGWAVAAARAEGGDGCGGVGAPPLPGMVRSNDAKLRFEDLRMTEGNNRCADCGGPCADWASISHGSFVCLNCAGRHRKLGLHVSFTRSLLMDHWSEGQLRRMEAGGNHRLSEFLRLAGLFSWSSIEEKYEHPCLSLYRDYIAARAEGKNPPPLKKENLEKVMRAGAEGIDDGAGEGLLGGVITYVYSCGAVGDALRRWSGHGVVRAAAAARGGGVLGAGIRGGVVAGPKWVPDDEKEGCMLCGTRFTLTRRRHHCRRCGRLACDFCAPSDNTRPILEWGLPHAVRHCHNCYRSPLLEWANVPTLSDQQ